MRNRSSDAGQQSENDQHVEQAYPRTADNVEAAD